MSWSTNGFVFASYQTRRYRTAVTLLALAVSTLLSGWGTCSPCSPSSSSSSSFLFSLVPVPACRDYALCLRGLAVRVLPCPQGTAFDPVNQICTSKLHKSCLVKENQIYHKTQLSCPRGTTTTYYPDYSHGCPSPRYFRCKDGVISGQSCAAGHVFDEGIDTCVTQATGVVCEVTGPVCTENSGSSATYANYVQGCPTVHFTMCFAGGTVAIKCPEGLFYNGAVKNCDYPDSIVCGYNVLGHRTR